jgi:hypothetical protein
MLLHQSSTEQPLQQYNTIQYKMGDWKPSQHELAGHGSWESWVSSLYFVASSSAPCQEPPILSTLLQDPEPQQVTPAGLHTCLNSQLFIIHKRQITVPYGGWQRACRLYYHITAYTTARSAKTNPRLADSVLHGLMQEHQRLDLHTAFPQNSPAPSLFLFGKALGSLCSVSYGLAGIIHAPRVFSWDSGVV